MTLDEAKQSVSIYDLAVEAGYSPKKSNSTEFRVICPNPNHNDTDASCFINIEKNLFNCYGCDSSGSVVDWIIMIEGCSVAEALEKLDIEKQETQLSSPPRKKKTKYVPPKAKDIPEAKAGRKYKPSPEYLTFIHEYKSGNNELLYKIERYDFPDKSKSFRMISIDSNGRDCYSMDSVIRVPYHFNEFDGNDVIWFVEGEKVADAVREAFGVASSTTCGGSKSWLPEYAVYFKDKDMILFNDNDAAGRKFMQIVAKDCSGSARSIKIIDRYTSADKQKIDLKNDIDDTTDLESLKKDIDREIEGSQNWIRGVQVDGASSSSLQDKLAKRYEEWADGGVDLKEFLPVLSQRRMRPLVGGDVLVITASTGAGKTSLAQGLAMFYDEYPIPWFSLELSDTRMEERNLIVSNRIKGEELEQRIRAGERFCDDKFKHIFIYDNPYAGLKYIDEQITAMPLMTGVKPRMTVIDYVQLMPPSHPSMGTVQKIEANAVGLKVLAKKHNMVFVVLSQIGRKDEANLSSAKGASGIEESSTVFFGLNNNEDYKDIKDLGVYKNSNGESSFVEQVGWDGEFFTFSCTASARNTMHNMESAEDEEEVEDEECPF